MEDKYCFISYSSKDREIVMKIMDEMRRWHIPFWVAPDNIMPGSNYAKEIPSAIENCACFVPVISENAQNSIWVEKEVDMAVSEKKSIFPIQIDEKPLSNMYKFYLNNVQTVSTVDNFDSGLEIVLKSILAKFAEKDQKVFTSDEKVKPEEKFDPYSDRINAFRTNRIPVYCRFCESKKLSYEGGGAYICNNCGRYTYDDYRTIRNYLEKNGSSSVMDIIRDTKIPWKNILSYVDSNVD